MEIRGKLVRWNDERGFGFIQSDELDKDLFIHISTLKNMVRKPKVGDVLYFIIATDNEGKDRAHNARIDGVAAKSTLTQPNPMPQPKLRKSYQRKKSTSSFRLVVFAILVCAVLIGKVFYPKQGPTIPVYTPATQQVAPVKYETEPVEYQFEPVEYKTAPAKPVATNFKCLGKQHCSQMVSCDEAKFYLRSCPDVKIDGDNDGIPCERQWCKGF